MTERTIKEALQGASFCLHEAGIDQPRKEAEYLLARIMNTDRLQLFLRQDETLSHAKEAVFQDAVTRRCCEEPAAYITGEKYFYGYRFAVTPAVLIPRPETELIIERALAVAGRLAGREGRGLVCADLGTGSGVLAVTLALLLPHSEVRAVDVSEAALKVGRLNAAAHNVGDRLHFHRGSFWDAFDNLEPRPGFNLIVSNPPYLGRRALENLPKGVKDYEPVQALNGGEDGLEGYRLILGRLAEYALAPAVLLLEVGAGQKEQIEELCFETGLFRAITWHYDLNNWPRVIEGQIS